MSTSDLPVDVDVLRDEIQKTYTDVSTQPGQDFIFPTGRAWAEDLGYPQPELSNVPEATVQSFAGVANPHVLGRIDEGATVLDLGCGAGTDLLIAAQMVGPEGHVIGVDMTPGMLRLAMASAREMGIAGATMLRGLMGFGAASRIHTAKILRLSEDLPIIIEIVDSADKIEALLPVIDEMVGEGLVTLEKVRILQYRHGSKKSE